MNDLEKIERLTAALDQFNASKAYNGSDVMAQKRAAILAGAGFDGPASYGETTFLAQIKAARMGDVDANQFVKTVLGTSDATGAALIPNNWIAQLVEQVAVRNVFRGLMTVNSGIMAAAIDVPYEKDAISAALPQGAWGSNKDVRDFGFAQATATLFTIAQIADVGNQLLRHSGGLAEASARRRLGLSFGVAESNWIVNGSGSGQPLGILTAIGQYGDPASGRYALNAEPRAAALLGGSTMLLARGVTPTAYVMHPTDWGLMAREGLGTSYAGGWAIDPAAGPVNGAPARYAWGLQIALCPDLPLGTALVADWTAADIFVGQEYRVDVSSEAGDRFSANVTGFRAEMEVGFTAEPLVRTGKVVKITGIG